MTRRVREQKRLAFAGMLSERGLTRAKTAELLHVSIDTINAWLKPETSKSSLPVPEWAPELLSFKVPANVLQRTKELADLKKRVAQHKFRTRGALR